MKKSKILIPTPSEYAEQVAVFKSAQLYVRQYPELRFLNGSLNGVRLSIGQAVKCKNIGMKAGYPDIFLPVCRGDFNGLFIELKRRKGGSIQPEQRVWQKFLLKQGFDHHFCYGSDEAWKIIIEYLNKT